MLDSKWYISQDFIIISRIFITHFISSLSEHMHRTLAYLFLFNTNEFYKVVTLWFKSYIKAFKIKLSFRNFINLQVIFISEKW